MPRTSPRTTHHVHHASRAMQAVGSLPLGRRVRALRPHMHVFGHSHFGWDQTLDGTR